MLKTFDRRLDRIYIQEKRQMQAMYPATDILPKFRAGTTFKYWNRPQILDQGVEGACVGFSAATFINAGPVRPKKVELLGNADARKIYKEAQEHDAWPGSDYEGSSVDGGALALRERGLIGAFYWAREIATVVKALLQHGPVMLGLDWTADMFTPDEKGVIRATGDVLGGHAVCAIGVNTEKVYKSPSGTFTGGVVLANSWGLGWGDNGCCIIPIEDLAKLLDGIQWPGDACVATETPRKRR